MKKIQNMKTKDNKTNNKMNNKLNNNNNNKDKVLLG